MTRATVPTPTQAACARQSRNAPQIPLAGHHASNAQRTHARPGKAYTPTPHAGQVPSASPSANARHIHHAFQNPHAGDLS